MERVRELKMDSLAITDHGNIYGAIEFYKKAKKQGIKSIIGAEIYISVGKMTDMQPGIDDVRYHMILLIKNEEGYRNLVKLLTKAHLEGFYYKPRVDEELLAKHSKGLIALSACLSGKIPRLIHANKMEEAEALSKKYEDMFGKGNFYLELQRHENLPQQKKVTDGLLAISKKTGIPVVATADSHYLRPEDAEAQDILMLINTGAKSNDPERLTLKENDFSLKSSEDMVELFKDIPESIANTQIIAEKCNLEITLGKNRLPVFPLPENITADKYLKQLCIEGLKKKSELVDSKEATDRLEHELDVIAQTGFAPYFLIVQDFVNWAKSQRIVVGPGRGSAGSSLVAYVLNITNVNPLRYNLVFERFLNKDRNEMPDFDIDFADSRRDEVIEYVAKKYGKDHVAQIITFGTMAARAVIRDVGRALEYEYGYCDRVAKMIPFGHSLDDALTKVSEFKDLYKTDEKAKRLIDLAKKLEGVARHASTHACGVVISPEPLDNLVPVQHPSQNDTNIVTQYEMHSIEDIGLLKVDFLGLKNLSIIEDTLKRIYAISGKNIDIENLPHDDPKVYEILQKGDSTGIFQLESAGMRRYLKELKPTKFEDIMAMIALYRPGPMEFIPDFIARKHGKKKITYLHPKLEPILKSTYGIAVYQEQVLQIARELAGFSYSEADVLRKAIGKKIKELLEEQREKFVKGIIANGIEESIAKQLFAFIEPFASYGFNRAHSAAYAIIGYQTAWLKTHYPVEFMSALLTLERNDSDRTSFLIEETRKMGIEVLAPDINESFSFFSVVPKQNKIRFGLAAIKNVGEGVVEAIIEERKANGNYASIHDFTSRVGSKDMNRKAMESMIKAGVFDNFTERNKLIHNVDRLLEASREKQRALENGQRGLFEGTEITKTEMKLEETKPATETERLSWEKELLGLYVSSHPLKSIKTLLERQTLSISKIIAGGDELMKPKYSFEHGSYKPRLRIGGIISSAKRIITKNGKPMLFLNLEDLTDSIEVVVFPRMIEKNPEALQENKIVLVTGRLDERNGEKKFVAEEIEELISR